MSNWGWNLSEILDANVKKLAKGVVAIMTTNNPGEVIASGFLMDEMTVVTAQHVVEKYNYNDLRCVFGFWDNVTLNKIADGQIYEIADVINGNPEDDYAWLNLKKQVKGFTALSLQDSGEPSPNDTVFVVGHPQGESIKFSPKCTISDINETTFTIGLQFEDCLSGAPVINNDSLTVEGIVSETKGGESFCVKARLIKQFV